MTQVAAGRWDVVVGAVVQPDTNLPATETLARHFTHGLQYFADRFGRRPRVAWAADSFWWEGPGGSQILSYRPVAG